MTHPDFSSTSPRILTWLDERTLHIQFNQPERHNAISLDMWEALPALLKQAEGDERVRLVVFSGAGEKAFVSGADITQFEDMRAAREAVSRYERVAEEALGSIHRFAKPTLACIQGYCIGGGINVAISCDLRIAAADAVFSIPAARLGLGYRYSALKNLVDLIGPAAAKDLFFTARRIGADEARSLGLVNRVAQPEALPALLAEYTSALAINAPLTILAAKAVTSHILATSPDRDLSACQQQIRQCFESADYAEGRQAFMEKRQPVFQGR